MEAEQEKPFSIDKFLESFNSCDADIKENALLDLLDYVKSVKIFNEFGKKGEVYVPTIINEILDTDVYINNPTMNLFDYILQLIYEFAAKLPINLLPVLYDTIFKKLEDKRISYFSNLSNVTEETINNSKNYEPERQRKIIQILADKLPRYIEGESYRKELKFFSLNLFALAIDTIPSSCLEPRIIENIKAMIERETKNLIKRKDVGSSNFLTTAKSIATLSKVYATLVNETQQHQFFDFIEKLENNPRLVTYLLSSIIEYSPQLFDLSEEKDIRYSFSYYQDLIFDQLNDLENVEEFSIADTFYTLQFLNTLTVMVKNFTKKMTDEDVNKYISITFDFLNLGSTETDDSEQNDEENDHYLDNDDDGDESSNEFVETDETWKIRIAAINLAIELINEKDDLFYDSLFYIDEESYMPRYVTKLIKDDDVGCKLESLRFLRAIIQHYKNDITQKVFDDFLNALISQINKRSNEQVNIQFIKTLTFIIDDLHQSPDFELSLGDILISAIKNIDNIRRENTFDLILEFVTSCLNYSNDPTLEFVKIANLIIKMISAILKEAKSNLLTKCLTVVSKIYHYYYKNCNKDSSLIKSLDDLNNFVISLVQSNGEVVIYAITTVSVFIVCCTNLDTVQKSVDLIVSLLDNNGVAKASVGAIALISASEAAQLLSKDIKSIVEKLAKQILSEQIIAIRALWAITLLLEKKILKSEDCQDIVDTLFDIFDKNKGKIQLLSLKILKQIYPNGCDSTKLSKFTNTLVNYPLSERAINEISELVYLSSKSSLDNIKPFVDSIIENVKDEAKTASNISHLGLIIGIASSTNKDYGLSLVSQFKSQINEKGVKQLFALKCIGEIGSFIDLSDIDGIYKPIFDLIYDKDNKIFVPATESIGLMSLGSAGKILKEFIKSAKENKDYVNPCLFGINSFTTQVNLFKKKNIIPKEVFEQIVKLIPEIADFLISNINEEFANTISDSLAGLVGISFDLHQELIKKEYVLIRSICVYMEKYSSYSDRPKLKDEEKEEVLSLLKKVVDIYDDDMPMLDFAIVSCIKFAITKNLCKQLLDNNMVNICLDGTKILQSHNIIKAIGTNQVTINIGTQLRSTSLTCIELLIKSDIADELDYQDIAAYILESFALESSLDLRKKCLDIFRTMMNSSIQGVPDIVLDINVNDLSLIDYLKSFDNVIANENPPDEIKISYYSTLLSLISISQTPPNESIFAYSAEKAKKLLMIHSQDPILKRVENNNQLRKAVSSNSLCFTNDYTSSKLMEEFNTEAASIFSN